MRNKLLVSTAFVLLLYFGLSAAGGEIPPETIEEQASRIHRSTVICDLHADSFTIVHRKKVSFLRGSSALQVDLPKLREANVALSSQAIWVLNRALRTNPLDYVLSAMETFDRTMREGSDSIRRVRGYREFLQARIEGKIAIVLTVEDGRAIEGSIENLHMLYERGVRGMTITWNLNNRLATSAWEARRRKGQGLTPTGRKVVREMEKLGMMIDVSHVSTQTFRDILDEVKVPIYASHSCARQLNNHWRNLWDWQIEAIAERGGVIGVNFYNVHLRRDRKRSSPRDVARHIDHMVEVGGIDVVAIGSDYDGDIGSCGRLEDISKLQALTEELIRRGYSEEDIRKILGGNFLRYFKTICP